MIKISDNLMESVKFTEFLFNNISTAVMIIDKQFKVQKVNSTFISLFHRDDIDVINELCGNSMGCSFAVEQNKSCGETSECDNCCLRQSISKAFAFNDQVQSSYLTKKFYISDQYVTKHFRIRIKSISYINNDLAIITADDVTELEEQKSQIIEMANRDYLTKLYNRKYLYEYGGLIFQNARRGNISIAVVMIDIDLFKNVNDTFGHEAGDHILVSFSDILRSNLRQADLISRFGGEEFCLILTIKKPDDALMVIENIRKSVQTKVFDYKHNKISITVSCGVTLNLEDTLEKMIKRSDDMMYDAKIKGRNQTCIYN